MVAKDEFLKSRLFHFFAFFLLIYICNNIQSVFLAQMSYAWFHIDLVSIIVAYLCLEHHVLFAALQAIFAGILLQVSSSSPHLFFILYFLQMIFVSNSIQKFFVINSVISKVSIFFLLYLSKYILFYFSLNSRKQVSVMTLVSFYWKEFIATFIISFFVYKLLLNFDSLFMLPGTIKRK